MTNIASLLEESVKKFGYRRAVSSGRRKLNYRNLNHLADNLASFLVKKEDLEKGSKIAILLENSVDYFICLFAIAKAGMISVPINVFLKSNEVSYVLNNCEANLLISSSKFLSILKEIRKKIEISKDFIITDKKIENYLYLDDILAKDLPGDLNQEIDENDIALISYTSSTTGSPKGVLLTHKNLVSNVSSCLKAFKVNRNDRFLLLLPVFHAFTLTVCVFLPIAAGAHVVILESIKPIRKVVRKIIFNRITILIGIPQLFRIFSEVNLPKYFRLLFLFSPLRVAISGAAALDKNVALSFIKRYKIELLEGYGLAEASPVVSINPIDGLNKIGSVGLPLPDIEVKVVDTEENELPRDEIGELIVKGPNVMRGYYDMPEETGQVIRGGWLFTGDLVKIDKDGYIHIVDRKKDIVISHGMNIYPRELEEVIELHPKVKEVAVIGKKDKFKGEVPVAVVVPKEGETLEAREIIDYCKPRLANYKIPHIIKIRSDLPKTPTGKVLKRVLRADYQ